MNDTVSRKGYMVQCANAFRGCEKVGRLRKPPTEKWFCEDCVKAQRTSTW